MTVVVYLKNGSTALFKDVENFDISEELPNGTYIGFTYLGESTQVRREAMFNLNCIAGFSNQIN